MKISWYGKYAIVEYHDGNYYNGQINLNTEKRNGIGAMYDSDDNLLCCGEWENDQLIDDMDIERYNKIRIDW